MKGEEHHMPMGERAPRLGERRRRKGQARRGKRETRKGSGDEVGGDEQGKEKRQVGL